MMQCKMICRLNNFPISIGWTSRNQKEKASSRKGGTKTQRTRKAFLCGAFAALSRPCGIKVFAFLATLELVRDYSEFSDKLKTAALWAAQKTSGRMIQRQNHSAEKLFCQKLSEFYSDFGCLMA